MILSDCKYIGSMEKSNSKRIRKSEISEDVVLLGLRIKKLITDKGLKTREVAHDADMDVENLRKYINGKQEMKVGTMLKIAKALNIKIAELFPEV